MKMFMSDNNSGVHPKVMEAMLNVNSGHDYSYGNDNTTKEAINKIKEQLGADVDVYFVTTGTAANVIGLSGLLMPYEAVVCANTAHINVDECGALEKFSGAKILQIPTENGKICREGVKSFLHSLGDEHQSQPMIISISQTTETGTLYSVEEIKKLAEFAHENNMLLHIDGARIANAVVALNTTFKEMITDTGVDLLSFGGTKNGMMIGEAIVSLNKDLSKAFKFYRKQGMQLLSKMRFVSAQFVAYLSDDLWRENALNANNMGKYFASSLSGISGITLKSEPETNMIFAYMERDLIKSLQEKFDFYVIDEETNLVRLVTSFDTNKEDIDKFIKFAKEIKGII
ncbi:low specificity L-threonine aldolase [uncultured Tissierella sp.]|jgi:threonine aldolase|uniref:threonine aldolase family protein n=1 Tax=uncultured Tissierella sp. TaxID=448160 RepID=UPI0028047636|nr:low specificity L-threonine aldolase [uncultured Tissierella sp.]MDU5081118.1 low specificity L-threonine aldolase [Bacillota bacterium]